MRVQLKLEEPASETRRESAVHFIVNGAYIFEIEDV